MSVSVDELSRQAAALRFLQARRAMFANYLLNEEPSVWQEKFNINGPPCVFIFDREGREAAKFDHNNPDKEFTYIEVEERVKQLLAGGK